MNEKCCFLKYNVFFSKKSANFVPYCDGLKYKETVWMVNMTSL